MSETERKLRRLPVVSVLWDGRSPEQIEASYDLREGLEEAAPAVHAELDRLYHEVARAMDLCTTIEHLLEVPRLDPSEPLADRLTRVYLHVVDHRNRAAKAERARDRWKRRAKRSEENDAKPLREKAAVLAKKRKAGRSDDT